MMRTICISLIVLALGVYCTQAVVPIFRNGFDQCSPETFSDFLGQAGVNIGAKYFEPHNDALFACRHTLTLSEMSGAAPVDQNHLTNFSRMIVNASLSTASVNNVVRFWNVSSRRFEQWAFHDEDSKSPANPRYARIFNESCANNAYAMYGNDPLAARRYITQHCVSRTTTNATLYCQQHWQASCPDVVAMRTSPKTYREWNDPTKTNPFCPEYCLDPLKFDDDIQEYVLHFTALLPYIIAESARDLGVFNYTELVYTDKFHVGMAFHSDPSGLNLNSGAESIIASTDGYVQNYYPPRFSMSGSQANPKQYVVSTTEYRFDRGVPTILLRLPIYSGQEWRGEIAGIFPIVCRFFNDLHTMVPDVGFYVIHMDSNIIHGDATAYRNIFCPSAACSNGGTKWSPALHWQQYPLAPPSFAQASPTSAGWVSVLMAQASSSDFSRTNVSVTMVNNTESYIFTSFIACSHFPCPKMFISVVVHKDELDRRSAWQMSSNVVEFDHKIDSGVQTHKVDLKNTGTTGFSWGSTPQSSQVLVSPAQGHLDPGASTSVTIALKDPSQWSGPIDPNSPILVIFSSKSLPSSCLAPLDFVISFRTSSSVSIATIALIVVVTFALMFGICWFAMTLFNAKQSAKYAGSKLKAERDFIAYVFHELPNPLNGVISHLEFIAETIEEEEQNTTACERESDSQKVPKPAEIAGSAHFNSLEFHEIRRKLPTKSKGLSATLSAKFITKKHRHDVLLDSPALHDVVSEDGFSSPVSGVDTDSLRYAQRVGTLPDDTTEEKVAARELETKTAETQPPPPQANPENAVAIKDDLRHAMVCCSHIMDMLNHVLDLSKLSEGKLILDPKPANIVDICVAVRSMMLNVNKNVDVEVIYDPDIPPVYVDSRRMRQVMVNLMSNSLKFTQQGFVCLCVGVAPQMETDEPEFMFANVDACLAPQSGNDNNNDIDTQTTENKKNVPTMATTSPVNPARQPHPIPETLIQVATSKPNSPPQTGMTVQPQRNEPTRSKSNAFSLNKVVPLQSPPSSATSHIVLQIAIVDSGVGIPEHQQNLLFQKYQQLRSSPGVSSPGPGKTGGSGLGLVISQQIVNLMGSEISVKSPWCDKHSGSAFFFTCPFDVCPTDAEVDEPWVEPGLIKSSDAKHASMPVGDNTSPTGQIGTGVPTGKSKKIPEIAEEEQSIVVRQFTGASATEIASVPASTFSARQPYQTPVPAARGLMMKTPSRTNRFRKLSRRSANPSLVSALVRGIHVPRRGDYSPTSSEASLPHSNLPKNWRFLIADDVPMNRAILKRKLSKLRGPNSNWVFDEASTGVEAMTMVGSDAVGKYDVVVIDQHMGDDVHGTHVVQEIRRLEAKTRVSKEDGCIAIICSGAMSTSQNYKFFMDSGADMVWGKPIPSVKIMAAQLFTCIYARSSRSDV